MVMEEGAGLDLDRKGPEAEKVISIDDVLPGLPCPYGWV